MSASKETSGPLELLKERFSHFVTPESRQNGLNFAPRTTDVIINTPSKCGTTWMQQIVHQLRSGGDMSFTDIDEVVPWLEFAHDLEQDLDAEQQYQPRCFTSHIWEESCPKGGKYIAVYREPCASFYSAFNFYQGIFFQKGEISLHEYVHSMQLSRWQHSYPNYFKHLLSWWPRRNDANVLFLFYEDMLEDLESAVRAVASLMEIDDEACIMNAVKMSKFEFMKENQDKFSSRRATRYRLPKMGLPDNVSWKRVATGSATKGRDLMDDCTRKAVQRMWSEVVTKEIAFKDYNELRSALKKEKQFSL